MLLTPPKFLNDPWDFLPQGRPATYEETIKEHQKIEKEIAQSSAHIPAEFAQLKPQERLQRMLAVAKSSKFVGGLAKHSQEYVSSRYGIVSFTEKSSCRLMWAHYAASHSGFVAEFSVTKTFERPAEKLTFCCCIGNPAAKVKYPAPFKPCAWTRDNIVEASWSKHPLWEYEQEWRILLPLDDKSVRRCKDRYCLPFSPEQLIRVIFGMRMNQEDQQRLRLMLNQNEFKNVQKQTTDIDDETGGLILKQYPKPDE